MKNKKIHLLIAGGTGFIGTNIAKRAIKKKWKVTSLSNTKPRIYRRIKGVKYLRLDITKKEQFKKLKERYTFVINLSGYSSNLYVKKYQKKIYRSHANGSVNLMNFFLKKNIKNFIQIGSSAEYGNAPYPQNENHICKPTNIYGSSKLIATKYLLKIVKEKNFSGNVLRFFQVYGPKQGKSRAIIQLLDFCYKNKIFPASDGKQVRDFCYIEDAASAIFKTLVNYRIKGQIINIGSGKGISFKILIKKILKLTKGGKPIYGAFKARNHENKKLVPSIQKAKRLLNWTPKISLDEGLIKTLKYIKNEK